MAFTTEDILNEFNDAALMGIKGVWSLGSAGQGGFSILRDNESRKRWRQANRDHVRRTARQKYLRNRPTALAYQRWYYETTAKQARAEARTLAKARKAALPPVPRKKPVGRYGGTDHNTSLTIEVLVGLGMSQRATGRFLDISGTCVGKVLKRRGLRGRV